MNLPYDVARCEGIADPAAPCVWCRRRTAPWTVGQQVIIAPAVQYRGMDHGMNVYECSNFIEPAATIGGNHA